MQEKHTRWSYRGLLRSGVGRAISTTDSGMPSKPLFSWVSDTMQVAPIVTKAEYSRALIEIRRLIADEPDCGTPDGERVEALSFAAEVFEAGHHPLDLADIAAR